MKFIFRVVSYTLAPYILASITNHQILIYMLCDYIMIQSQLHIKRMTEGLSLTPSVFYIIFVLFN